MISKIQEKFKSHFSTIERAQFGFVFSFCVFKGTSLNLSFNMYYPQNSLNFFTHQALLNNPVIAQIPKMMIIEDSKHDKFQEKRSGHQWQLIGYLVLNKQFLLHLK